MNILFFDPGSTSGIDGYINYKMSGGGGSGSGGGGSNSGCFKWIVIIVVVLYVLLKLFAAFN